MKMPDWKKVAATAGGSGIVLVALMAYFEPAPNPGIPYRDITGVPTNCQGNTHGVDLGRVYTEDECNVIDRRNRQVAIEELHKAVTTPLTRNQTDAFADLIINIGIVNFTTTCRKGVCGDSTLYKNLKAGNVTAACKNILDYTYADGKKLRGLVIRRQAEYDICMTEDPK